MLSCGPFLVSLRIRFRLWRLHRSECVLWVRQQSVFRPFWGPLVRPRSMLPASTRAAFSNTSSFKIKSDGETDYLSAALASEKFVVVISEEITNSSQVLASLHYAFQIYHQRLYWFASSIFKRHDWNWPFLLVYLYQHSVKAARSGLLLDIFN